MSSGPGKKKLALIHVARRDLALGEDDYRAILQRVANVDSATELDELGFLNLMQHFRTLGFRSTSDKRNFGPRNGMASPAQVAMIRALWAQYAGEFVASDLDAWLERFHKISSLRFVDAKKAAKILPALKAMASREKSGH